MRTPLETLVLPLPCRWFDTKVPVPLSREGRCRLVEHQNSLDNLTRRILVLKPGSAGCEETEDALDGAQRLFDEYFKVKRCSGPPINLLRDAMATALPYCLADLQSGSSLSQRETSTLALGLHTLADWVHVPATPPQGSTVGLPTPAIAENERDLYRWKLQHHLFFLIVHGMLCMLGALEEALNRNDSATTRTILEDFADLMFASAMAFKVAGDLSVEGYENQIRPDMQEHDPHFSGLFYADHKQLVSSLRVLQQIPSQFAENLEALGSAIDAAYEAHALVCIRFVGRAASLAAKQEDRSAAESIRGKYVRRTKGIAGLG